MSSDLNPTWFQWDKHLGPSTWKGELRADLTKSALVCCPSGHVFSLSDHEVDEKGNVSPSVKCPWDGCGFDQSITLMGWEMFAEPLDGW